MSSPGRDRSESKSSRKVEFDRAERGRANSTASRGSPTLHRSATKQGSELSNTEIRLQVIACNEHLVLLCPSSETVEQLTHRVEQLLAASTPDQKSSKIMSVSRVTGQRLKGEDRVGDLLSRDEVVVMDKNAWGNLLEDLIAGVKS